MALASLPSDIELSNMLRTRVHSMPLPSPLTIHEADVYAANPTDLTSRFAPVVAEDGEKAWYFFTELQPKNQGGKRKKRCTNSGVWHDEGKSKPVVDSQSQIGSRRNLFSFQTKEPDGKNVRSGWLMREYQLQGGNGENNLVLCKIYNRWSGRRGATTGNEEVAPPAVLPEPVMLEAPPSPTGFPYPSLPDTYYSIQPFMHLQHGLQPSPPTPLVELPTGGPHFQLGVPPAPDNDLWMQLVDFESF